MSKLKVTDLFDKNDGVVVTAHRGFSGRYPENTLMAFDEALKIGADLIEFDLRASSDGVPIVLHDRTLNRTTNGTDEPEKYSLLELKRLNASFWQGYAGDGRHLEQPMYKDVTIPTFEEVLQAMPETIGLNIQVYTADLKLLKTICQLYQKYDLYGRGYLTMDTIADAKNIQQIDPDIDLCILERQGTIDRAMLEAFKKVGARIIQPLHQEVTPEFCAMINEMNLCPNMFFSNTDEDNRRYIDMGMRGILTDFPDRLLRTLGRLK